MGGSRRELYLHVRRSYKLSTPASSMCVGTLLKVVQTTNGFCHSGTYIFIVPCALSGGNGVFHRN